LGKLLKKISINQLQPGMFVHDLDCAWMDHPFLSNQFAIRSAQDIRKIRKVGVQELYIDTEKGKDVAQAPTADNVRREVQEKLEATPESLATPEKPVSVFEELDRARKVRHEAEQTVSDIMRDVRLGKQIEIEQIHPVVEKMVSSIFRNDDALLGLTRIRRMDRYTFEHSVSVAVMLVSFAKTMGMQRETIHEMGIGGLLHDIGKTKTPNDILNKPSKLTEEEFTVMREHVVHSREILSRLEGIPTVALNVAAEHHERYDGSGYPAGIKGEEISEHGQMASIVDVYDAVSADRVYHKGMEPHDVLRKLIEWSKHHFEPKLVQHFIQCVGIYPAGTMVELTSGELAVVIATGSNGLFHPLVRVVDDRKRDIYLSPRDIDLSNQPEGMEQGIQCAVAPERWGIRPERFLDETGAIPL
jgi:putative nucleotidyltransferase with HDIG domain